jgi:hypothetical protein
VQLKGSHKTKVRGTVELKHFWFRCVLPQHNKCLVVQKFLLKQGRMELLHSPEAILCYQHGYLVLESTSKNQKTPYSVVQGPKLYTIHIVGDYNRKNIQW